MRIHIQFWMNRRLGIEFYSHPHTLTQQAIHLCFYACLRVWEQIWVCLLLLSSLKLFALIYYTNNSIFLHGPNASECVLYVYVCYLLFCPLIRIDSKPFENGFKLVEYALAFNLITLLRNFCLFLLVFACMLMWFPFSFTFIFILFFRNVLNLLFYKREVTYTRTHWLVIKLEALLRMPLFTASCYFWCVF